MGVGCNHLAGTAEDTWIADADKGLRGRLKVDTHEIRMRSLDRYG